jgi:GGDEF domain-containing protein
MSKASTTSQSLHIQPRKHRVSFRTRQLERYLPISLACASALGLVLAQEGSLGAWAASGLALLVGVWSRSFPAQHQGVLLARAICLLLCGALMHHYSANPNALLVWTLVTTIGYGLLCHLTWALPVVGLGLLQYALLSTTHAPTQWLPWVNTLAQLVMWPVVAVLFGRSLQRSEEDMEENLVDHESGLYNRQGFFTYGADILQRCQRDGQAVTLVLIQCRNLEAVAKILGNKTLRQLLGKTVKAISTSADMVGNSLAARNDIGEFVLLLPGADAQRAKALLGKIFDDPHRISLQKDDRTITIMLDTATQAYSKELQTIEALYNAALNRLESKQRQLKANQQPAQATEHSTSTATTVNATSSDLRPIAELPGTAKPAGKSSKDGAKDKASSKSAAAKDKPAEKTKVAEKSKPAAKSKFKLPTLSSAREHHDFGATDSALLSRLEPSPTLPLPLTAQQQRISVT